MKVLFLYPNFYGMNMLPTGVGLLISHLSKAGHTSAVFDTTQYIDWFGEDNDKKKTENLSARTYDEGMIRKGDKHTSPIDDFRNLVINFSPDLIALSLTEDMYKNGLLFLQSIDAKDRPKVVAGGVFPTFAPELVLRSSGNLIDYVLIGEGENTLLQLCESLQGNKPIEKVEGIWFLRKDGSVQTSPAPRLIDINKSPLLPDFDLFDESRFYRPMVGKVWRMFPIETARGCPYTCAYCNSPSQASKYADENQHFFRKKKMELVRTEIEHVVTRYNADSIDFWADTFLAMSDYDFDEFIEMYSDIKLPFWIQNRTETVTEKKFQKLLDVGLMRVDFGIEHGNEEFRRKMLFRRVSNESIIKKLEIVSKLGVSFCTNNIIGFPLETRELAFDTIELNRQIRSDGCSVTTFVPFHGTPLRTMSETLGYVPPGQVAQSIFNPTMLKMPHWSSKEIAGLVRCFVLYVSLPKSMWPEVKKAEKLTPKGDQIWNKLRQYALDNEFVWKDPTINVKENLPDVGPTSDGFAVPLKDSLIQH
jgi:anaerobic magnesium-protoporphyrin IX monomethyl ester cyclase